MKLIDWIARSKVKTLVGWQFNYYFLVHIMILKVDLHKNENVA